MVEPQNFYEAWSTCSTGARPSCAPSKTHNPERGIALLRSFEDDLISDVESWEEFSLRLGLEGGAEI